MQNICHEANAQHPNDVSSQLTEIANRGTKLALDAQKLIIYEIIQANQDALEQARPVVVCCASGTRSAMAKSMLERAGFRSVHNAGSWRALEMA